MFINLGFGLNNVLLLVAGVYCLLNRSIFMRDLKLYRKEMALILIMIVYLFVITLSGGGYYKGVTALFGYFTTLLFLPIFLVHTLLINVKDKGFFNIIIHVGLIAAFISITCFLLPDFNLFIRSIQTDVEMESVDDLGLSMLRSFGLGGNLTSAYGYMMGLLSAFCLLKMPEVKKWYYLIYSLLFLIAAIINARTSVFPFLFSLVFLLLKSLKTLSIKFIAIVGLIIAALGYGLFSYLERNNPEMFDYLYTFIDFFSSYENLEDSAYSSMWFFPETVQGVVFGEGRSVFGADNELNMSSDIGFVRNIYLGGLFFLFLLFNEQFIQYKNMYERSNKELFVIILALSVIVFHYKGSLCYITTAVSRFVMLYYFVLVFNKRSKNQEIVLFKS